MKKLLQILMPFAFSMGLPDATAQMKPLGSMYFQNPYLANPAMAGLSKSVHLNLSVRKQWINMPGSPTNQAVSADYGLTNRAGIGLNIYNEKAGLYRRTRSVGTFAYHLPLNDLNNQKLSFGISIGFLTRRFSTIDSNGDPDDVEFRNYNQRETFIDSDFGMAYTHNKLNIQAALPNLKYLLKKDFMGAQSDQAMYFSSVSYRFTLNEAAAEDFEIEPKVAVRGIKNFGAVVDAGANVTYAQRMVSMFAMYHSSSNATFGLGMTFKSVSFMAIYTSANSAFDNHANGDFEVGLKLKL